MKNLRPAFYAIICLVIFMTISLSMCAQYQNIGGNMNYTGNIRTANGIAIGDTNRSASALLHIKGASKGVVLPISTTAQMLATSSPPNALLLFNSDSSKFYYYTTNNTTWNQLAGSTSTPQTSQKIFGNIVENSKKAFIANASDYVSGEAYYKKNGFIRPAPVVVTIKSDSVFVHSSRFSFTQNATDSFFVLIKK